MLHEVILALLGHPGAIIQEEATPASSSSRDASADAIATAATGTFRVPDSITFLTSTEREAINRVVGMGSIYRDLRCFIRPVYGAQQEKGGLYLRALKVGVCEVLDEYAERVAEVERDVMADPTLTLARVYAGVREVSCLDTFVPPFPPPLRYCCRRLLYATILLKRHEYCCYVVINA